ncbi:hypothetical protein M6D93_07720 [Jatrophihabitans telluris]|uniref:ATP/GTP-binding protein n=1 Tax=Jatrophihabitans telluris TaxID=2038343 RepID=A0ABY4R479_9ACTN|nr:hypothetical protein [Jatrophihabitans telluris]UQX89881.1 hypothetical protein M6D93_07720 [Jatrophihabitans telluris]
MPRRNHSARSSARSTRESGRQHGAAGPDGGRPSAFDQRTESWRGEQYVVRAVTGSGSAGPYRCPGCDQVLAAGVAHIVAWPAHHDDAADRRHWHSACWAARAARGPDVLRSRNAPRYGR